MLLTNTAIRISQLFFCEITAGAAGTILVLFLVLAERTSEWRNSRIKLLWIRTAVFFFLFPAGVLPVLVSRFRFSAHGIVAFSDFGQTATPPMRRVYLLAGIVWVIGLAAVGIWRLGSYRNYRKILAGSVELADERAQKIVSRYIENEVFRHVRVLQNDLLTFPITKGIWKTEILLPMKDYQEKELHMIMEHECIHIRRHDLCWKRAGLFVTFFHWWNPFAYLLLEKLSLQTEIECDIRTCEQNEYFTMREYGYYLAGMPEEANGLLFGVALQRAKTEIFRRLEGMVQGKKYKKRTAVVSCLFLSAAAVFPSYAASEHFVQANERWSRKTEAAVELEQVDFQALEQTAEVSDTPKVQEIDLTQEEMLTGTTITLDRTIAANTRVLYSWQKMQAGSVITISTKCSDSSITYRIGIRSRDGKLTYIEGSGSLVHPFVIDAAGEYTAYVENCSSKSMKVTGDAAYMR